MEGLSDFLAFDVETANENRDSICSIAVVIVRGNSVVKKAQYLVKPLTPYFNSRNTEIHGISPEDVFNADEFDKVWEELKSDFMNLPIVAHNISFDLECLLKTLANYGIDFKPIAAYCTFEATNKSLDKVCQEFNIPLNHHDSLSDALACAVIARRITTGINLNEREKDRYKDNLNPWKREKVSSEFLKPDFQNANSTTIFYMSKVVITGVFQGFQRNEIAQLLKQMGADIDTSVTSKTNYLLAGQGMGPSKREKAEKLGVRILNEQEFITLING